MELKMNIIKKVKKFVKELVVDKPSSNATIFRSAPKVKLVGLKVIRKDGTIEEIQ
jgi:hypothetical protein